MLSKVKGQYYLSEGNSNHFVVFDLGKKFYLKEIKLSVHDFECSLRKFKISVENDYGKIVGVGEYECEPFSKEWDYKFFQVCCEGRIFRFISLTIILIIYLP